MSNAKRRLPYCPIAPLIIFAAFATLALQAGSSSAATQEGDAAAPQSDGKATAAADTQAEAKPPAKNLPQVTGLWRLDGVIGENGLVTDVRGNIEAVKFIASGRWSVTYRDLETGLVQSHMGGTYALNKEEYAEKVDYSIERTSEMIGQTNRFAIHIEDDTMTIQGQGNSFNEVWKRVNEEEREQKMGQQFPGLWRLDGRIGPSGLVTDAPAEVVAIKHIASGHWGVTYYAAATGVVQFHHGGTYTLKDGEYAENLKYAMENTATMIGQTNRFDIHIEDDTLTNQGQGNSYNEVWKRVKEEDR
ncbi:MAG: hypothetical protein WDZ59_01115 [Pirellulales bacterium]